MFWRAESLTFVHIVESLDRGPFRSDLPAMIELQQEQKQSEKVDNQKDHFEPNSVQQDLHGAIE